MRGRRARVCLWACLLIVVGCASSPPPPPPYGVREVEGNVLTSTAMPRANLVVSDVFFYAGSQTIRLYDVARAEQHFFASLGPQGTVDRLVWVQYESILDGVDQTYDYSRLPTVALGDLVVHHDAAFYPTSELDDPPGSDGARAKGFLQTVGYFLGDEVLRWRFVWVADTGRNELLVIYMEDLATLGLSVADLQDEARWAEVSEAALERAMDAVQLNIN